MPESMRLGTETLAPIAGPTIAPPPPRPRIGTRGTPSRLDGDGAREQEISNEDACVCGRGSDVACSKSSSAGERPRRTKG